MDWDCLTTERATHPGKALYPRLNYLSRLKRGIESTGWPPGESLFRKVCDAYDALLRLWIEVRFLSCQSGVGRPPRP